MFHQGEVSFESAGSRKPTFFGFGSPARAIFGRQIGRRLPASLSDFLSVELARFRGDPGSPVDTLLFASGGGVPLLRVHRGSGFSFLVSTAFAKKPDIQAICPKNSGNLVLSPAREAFCRGFVGSEKTDRSSFTCSLLK